MKLKPSDNISSKKVEQQHLEQVNLYAAGIDIGSQSHFVAVPPALDSQPVREFSCFTADLESMADWLVKIGVLTIAMESTGIYWIPAFEILESRGLEVLLVNARQVKNVSGRKTDVQDCQWLQQLHTYGLLAGAFRPEDDYVVLRSYMRQRETLVSQQSVSIQHMQKSLRQMNLLLDNVVSDVTGKTGMAIIRGILSGERAPTKLASFRDGRCKKSEKTIAASLKGNFRAEHLFTLKQSVELYDVYRAKLNDCDHQIEKHLSGLHKATYSTGVPPGKKYKDKNSNALLFDGSQKLYELCGTDLTQIDGLDENGVLKVISETGIDMSRWKTDKHFNSWVGLSPNNKISGGKILSGRSTKTRNRVKQVFKMAAMSLANSKSGLGAYYRRLRSRLGSPKAINATARKLATIFYKMLRYKTSYRAQSQEEYEEGRKQQIMKQLRKKAKQFGFMVVAEP